MIARQHALKTPDLTISGISQMPINTLSDFPLEAIRSHFNANGLKAHYVSMRQVSSYIETHFREHQD